MLHLLIESTSSAKTKLKQTYSIIFTKFVIFTPQKVELLKAKKSNPQTCVYYNKK